MASLKKASGFEEDNLTSKNNKLEVFINKVRAEVEKGNINESAGSDLISEATHLINMLKMSEDL